LLGTCYHNGDGVPQSSEMAAELWKQAADKGHARAQACLGELYCNGLGVPQSYERAAELHTQAAAQGDTDAQACLGELYCNGLGVPKDVARGVALLKREGVAPAQLESNDHTQQSSDQGPSSRCGLGG